MKNNYEAIVLDCSNDDKRIVKYKDIQVIKLVERSGFLWLRKQETYIATHMLSGVTNGRGHYLSDTLEHAINDCIYNVLRSDWQP